MWWSETPNGAPLPGEKCEVWLSQARENVLWTQDDTLSAAACDLGTESRILYLNFETRCLPERYEPLLRDRLLEIEEQLRELTDKLDQGEITQETYDEDRAEVDADRAEVMAEGACDDETPRKSNIVYQFDAARIVKGY